MKLTDVQDLAIQARTALLVGAKTFDQLFIGVQFDEADGSVLYVYAKDEQRAAAIEDNFAVHLATIASEILQREIDIVLVLPKVLQ